MRQETLQRLLVGVIIAVVVIGGIILYMNANRVPGTTVTTRPTFDAGTGTLSPTPTQPTPSQPAFDENAFRRELLDEIQDLLREQEEEREEEEETPLPEPSPALTCNQRIAQAESAFQAAEDNEDDLDDDLDDERKDVRDAQSDIARKETELADARARNDTSAILRLEEDLIDLEDDLEDEDEDLDDAEDDLDDAEDDTDDARENVRRVRQQCSTAVFSG